MTDYKIHPAIHLKLIVCQKHRIPEMLPRCKGIVRRFTSETTSITHPDDIVDTIR